MIGDLLFGTTPRDQQATVLDLVYENAVVSTAAAAHSARYQVPLDRVFRLDGTSLTGSGGGGQLVTSFQVNVNNPGLGTSCVLDSIGGLALATADRQFNPGMPVLIAPGYQITLIVGYNAAVAVNLSSLNLHGVMIPRGNTSLGQLIRTL